MTDLPPLQIFLVPQEGRRPDKEVVRASLKIGPIPVPADLQAAIDALPAGDAVEVLRDHPGFDTEDRIRSVRNILQLFDQANDDLTRALDDFDAFARSDFGSRTFRDETAPFERRVRKEIFAFSELAHSLQDHHRRLKARWDHPEARLRLTECFGADGLHDFICGLRSALHHKLMVEPGWQIRSGGQDVTSHFVFKRIELRWAKDDWNERAQRYLSTCGEEIEFRPVAEIYFRRVHSFYDWLHALSDTSAPAEVLDYRMCWESHMRSSSRASWRFLLHQFLGNEVDPYPYLDRYLSRSEIETALGFPKHSREQVDFIISVVDQRSACDDDIRRMAYRLFHVAEEGSTE